VSGDSRTLLLATHISSIASTTPCPPGSLQDQHDAVYFPRLSWITATWMFTTWDLAPMDRRSCEHAILLSCIGSEGWSFKPLWRPPVVMKLAPEDAATSMAWPWTKQAAPCDGSVASNVADGWRDRRASGGFVIDVETNEIVCEGLSMPHSPRLKDGALWLLNSGTGELGTVDAKAKRFEPRAFCPGYSVRGW